MVHDFQQLEIRWVRFLRSMIWTSFTVCNAAGLSAYHFIERTMGPLTAHLAGVVLPRDAYGTHLDNNGNTIDDEREIQHFAGELLCELWNDMMIDNYPVKCTFAYHQKSL